MLQSRSQKKNKKVEVIGQTADLVLQKYKDDPFERMRLVYNKELRPFQWEWFFLMDEHPDILCKACPRVGKTVGIALKGLDETAMYPDEEQMVFGPKYDQAVNAFKPAYDVIANAPVLQAFIKKNAAGKDEFGKGFVEFINNSSTRCFGVGSNFEGFNSTILHVDELDDVPADILKRIFGRTIGINKSGLPTRKRLSGVIWGKLNIYDFDENDPDFFTLPPVDVYQAMAGGFLAKKDVLHERRRMSSEEWLRTMCLHYVEGRNLVWESWLKISQMIGLRWNLKPIPPGSGEYPKRGWVSFGLDMGHQGTGDDASDYSLQVTEGIGKYRRWIWGRIWPPDADPNDIIRDIVEYWAFYRPDMGFGDSLDANLIAQINTALWEKGLVGFDWRHAGANDQNGWAKWAWEGLLTPIHNNGRTKHHFYTSLQRSIKGVMGYAESGELQGNVFIFPLLDRELARRKLPSWEDLQMTLRELGNLVGERLNSGILKIVRKNKTFDDKEMEESGSLRLKDDRPDALAMSHYGLDFLHGRHSSGSGSDIKVSYLRGI